MKAVLFALIVGLLMVGCGGESADKLINVEKSRSVGFDMNTMSSKGAYVEQTAIRVGDFLWEKRNGKWRSTKDSWRPRDIEAVAAIEEYMQTEEAQLLLSDERDAKSHQDSIRIDLPAQPPNP